MEENTDTLEVTAQVVGRWDRFGLLYRTFGPYAPKVERLSYNVSDRLIDGYGGGDWEYVHLSNGGMFAFLDEERFALSSPNGSEYDLTGEAAGLTVWLFTSSWGAGMFEGNQDLQRASTRNYELLRDFALQHNEAGKILALCD